METILEKARGMSALLSSLLTLARADKGHLKLIKEQIDLSALCEAVIDGISESALEKNIKVQSNIENNVFVEGDQTMIIQGLLNLCENGIKYGKTNGSLKISLYSENGYALFKVEDDGTGISKENIERIWERFFREEQARTGGSGLGLPLVKYIATAHNGYVSASSVKDKGSIFIFALPLM